MKPKRITKADLIATIRDMIEVIQADDSFEGSLEYSSMYELCARGEFMVSASYRVGNSQGQGGCRMIGNP